MRVPSTPPLSVRSFADPQLASLVLTLLLALKKKRGVVIEDLFGGAAAEAEDADSLFAKKKAPKPVETSDESIKSTVYKQTPERRNEKFQHLIVHVGDRIGKKPKIVHPPMRFSEWTHLFDLASSAEQLKLVSDMFYKWKDAGHELREEQVELFVRE